MSFSGAMVHVVPASTAVGLGDTPSTRKLPEANRLVICLVRGGNDDILRTFALKRIFRNKFPELGDSKKKEGMWPARSPHPNKGFAVSQKLVYSLRPKLMDMTAVTS